MAGPWLPGVGQAVDSEAARHRDAINPVESVRRWYRLVSGQGSLVSVTVSMPWIVGNWIDLDGDGIWAAGEWVLAGVMVPRGEHLHPTALHRAARFGLWRGYQAGSGPPFPPKAPKRIVILSRILPGWIGGYARGFDDPRHCVGRTRLPEQGAIDRGGRAGGRCCLIDAGEGVPQAATGAWTRGRMPACWGYG